MNYYGQDWRSGETCKEKQLNVMQKLNELSQSVIASKENCEFLTQNGLCAQQLVFNNVKSKQNIFV